ncbi:MAG: TonB-dependent receptor P26 [Petrimonas sp.]|uniref:SusC/RagA family TonB-linked outer membrane protein n=1 Tax=Petrimonas sp. TaxID=2023866 RepID=UPI0030D2CC7E
MKRKLTMFLSLFFLGIGIVLAQTQVRGIVVDETGESAIGATIQVKGTTQGTVTDANGNFTITAPTGGTLVVSYVGYTTQEVPVSANVRIVLASDAALLEEVIITAYGGTMRKSSLSGAITSVKGDQLNNLPVQSFDQALAGKTAGVQITQSSGLLADGVSIRIRGTNSISLSSQPLVVIDGVPVTETTNLNVFNSGNGTRFNPMATINPNDIESMEVLKDAAAAALYGSRAANGVLLITTKRGREGKTTVSYNGFIGTSKATRLPDLLNAQDFIDITNEKAANTYGAGVKLADWDANKTETNWLERVFRTGLAQNHSLSVSGGTKLMSVYASADWTNQKGITIGNQMDRGSVRLNADAQTTEWLKIGISANYSYTKNKGVLSDGYLAGVTIAGYNAPPNVPEFNADGSYYFDNLGRLGAGANRYAYNGANTFLNAFNHPTATVNLQRNDNISERILANAYAEISPVKGLKITSRFAVDHLNNFEDQYSHPSISGLGRSYGGLVQENIAFIKQWNWQNFANYNFNIDDHTFALMAGLEYQKRKYQDIYAGAYEFVFDTYQHILDGLFTESMAGGTMNSRGNSSSFGRVNYSWKDRYIFEASFRADSYSGFSKTNRRGYFPGASAAWRISQEEFMQNVNLFSDLKLRGSWGIVGNSNVGPYAYRTTYAGGQYADINGVSMNVIGNENLKWERVEKIDVGIDAGFLSGKINASFDYWRSNVSDMILAAPVMHLAGIPNSSIQTNIGSMRNQGIELQINTINFDTKDWRWTSTFNLTTVNNKVLALAGDDILETASAIVGEPLGVWRIYRYAGVDPQTGRAGYYDKDDKIKYYDPNPAVPQAQRWKFEDGSVATPLGSADLSVQSGKTGTPTWYGNLDNTVRFRDIDLTIGLQYGGGNYILNQTNAGLMTFMLNNNIERIKDRWTTPGQETDIPKIYHGDRTSLPSNSTLWLEKADFLRLRDITLGYTFPTTLSNKIGVSLARLFVRGSNLGVLTNYSGTDPEVSTNRNQNRLVGFDNRSVPYPRTITFGVNINL